MKVLRFNTTLIFFLLILTIPLVNADWDEMTVHVDTKVLTPDDRKYYYAAFPIVQLRYDVDNRPYYYIDSSYNHLLNNSLYPYSTSLVTFSNHSVNENIAFEVQYFSTEEFNHFFQLSFPVTPNTQYNLQFQTRFFYQQVDEPIRLYIYSSNASGRDTVIDTYLINDQHMFQHSILFETKSDTARLKLTFYDYDQQTSFNVYIDNISLYESEVHIKKDAETITYSRSDYSMIGSILLDSYQKFISDITNPLETLGNWLMNGVNYLKDKFKDFILGGWLI